MTGLALLPGDLMLSCSEDRSLRVWCLRTMKQLHVSRVPCRMVCSGGLTSPHLLLLRWLEAQAVAC